MKNKKYLIINADDFGMSSEFNQAICNLMTRGIVSSTSLMANGKAYEEAIQLIHKLELKDVGVHLALTCDDFENSNKIAYSSLTHARSLEDSNGILFCSYQDLAANASDEDIINEISAQINKITNDGIEYTHIDNHMYSVIHYLGLRGYKCLFKALYRLKSNRKVGFRHATKKYGIDGIRSVYPGRKIQLYAWVMSILFNLRCPDFVFTLPYTTPQNESVEQKCELLNTFFSNIKNGISELHVHPAIFSEELRKKNPTWKDRINEYEALKKYSEDLLKDKYGITLISYGDLVKFP
jgi:hypothetical protein